MELFLIFIHKILEFKALFKTIIDNYNIFHELFQHILMAVNGSMILLQNSLHALLELVFCLTSPMYKLHLRCIQWHSLTISDNL